MRHAVTSQGSPHRVLALLQELQRLHEAEARDARARGDRDQMRHLRDIAADIGRRARRIWERAYQGRR